MCPGVGQTNGLKVLVSTPVVSTQIMTSICKFPLCNLSFSVSLQFSFMNLSFGVLLNLWMSGDSSTDTIVFLKEKKLCVICHVSSITCHMSYCLLSKLNQLKLCLCWSKFTWLRETTYIQYTDQNIILHSAPFWWQDVCQVFLVIDIKFMR